MPTSNLYKVGRLINADYFSDRVGAAMLLHAQTLITGAAGNAKNLAVYVLLHPMQPETSMVAIVASDATVLQQVQLDGPVANVDDLLDAEITRVVAAKWGIVAAKYPTDPTPTA